MKRLVCGRWKVGYIRFTVREQVLLPLQGCQPGRGGNGGTLHGTRRHQVQLHALCLEGKIRKMIHKLVCFDSEMLFLTCFGLGCQGKLIPDLCGTQPMVALPAPWSSWTTLQSLRDVQDGVPSWAGLVSSQPGPFLHHHHGFFCGSASIAVAMRRDCAAFSEEVIHFQKMWPLRSLSLLSRGLKLCIFMILLLLRIRPSFIYSYKAHQLL